MHLIQHDCLLLSLADIHLNVEVGWAWAQKLDSGQAFYYLRPKAQARRARKMGKAQRAGKFIPSGPKGLKIFLLVLFSKVL
jgi:hypothetical protein